MSDTDTGFVLGWCAGCRKDVLTHPEWEPGETEPTLLCVHCDDPVERSRRPVDEGAIEDAGYVVGPDTPGCATCTFQEPKDEGGSTA